MLCSICNVILKTKHCQNGHKNLCNGKGQFGFKCLKCKKFTYRRNQETTQSLKQTHKCGIKACNICGNSYNPNDNEDVHMCPLKTETFSKNWPSLAFIKVVFQNLTSEECLECFQIKKSFAKENKISIKEVLKIKNNNLVKCKSHLFNEQMLETNLIMIYKEHKVKRGSFSRHVVSHILPEDCEESVLSYDYIGSLNTPSKFVSKSKRFTEDLKTILDKLQKINLDFISVINKFLKLILCDETGMWKNTTFIMEDEDSISMVNKLIIFS